MSYTVSFDFTSDSSSNQLTFKDIGTVATAATLAVASKTLQDMDVRELLGLILIL